MGPHTLCQYDAEYTARARVRALSRFLFVAHFAVFPVTELRALITCLAIVEQGLHDAIGAKPARGRVHGPEAVVTATARVGCRETRAPDGQQCSTNGRAAV